MEETPLVATGSSSSCDSSIRDRNDMIREVFYLVGIFNREANAENRDAAFVRIEDLVEEMISYGLCVIFHWGPSWHHPADYEIVIYETEFGDELRIDQIEQCGHPPGFHT